MKLFHQYKKFIALASTSAMMFFVRVAGAQATVPPPSAGTGWHSFKDIVDSAGSSASSKVLPILVLLAILAFFYNIIFFMLNLGNEKEREEFRKYTINALIVLTVLFTVWGVVGIFTQTFFHATPFIPQLPTSE